MTNVYDFDGRLTSRQFGGAAQTPLRLDFYYTTRDELYLVDCYRHEPGGQNLSRPG